MYLFIILFIYLFIYLFPHLFIYMYVCMYVSMYLFIIHLALSPFGGQIIPNISKFTNVGNLLRLSLIWTTKKR